MSRSEEALRDCLVGLYRDASKHAGYQSVPQFVAEAIGYQETIRQEWRGDQTRLDYVESFFARSAAGLPMRWCDFGANTGFFALSLAHRYPTVRMLALEANRRHARFIETIRDGFAMDNVEVRSGPVSLADLEDLPEQDVTLHLNVLHHAGVDFDAGLVNGPAGLFAYALRYFERLRERTARLVFQMGYNFGGDKARPIIEPADRPAMLKWLCRCLVAAGWRLEEVAYAAKGTEGAIRFLPLPPDLVAALAEAPEFVPAARVEAVLDPYRLDRHVGEFFLRPLIVCRRGPTGE